MLILPAIDIYAGRAVRLRQGEFAERTIYSDAPADLARAFLNAGLDHLHVVDLEGARRGEIVNWETIGAICSLAGVRAEVGGGVRSGDDIARLLGCGAGRVVVGSVAAREPSLLGEWIAGFGSGAVVAALDLRGEAIAVQGWEDLADGSPGDLLEALVATGLATCICTDIDRDGMLSGPNIPLYRSLRARFPSIELIASGGVADAGDLDLLAAAGVDGTVVGKAFYEGYITLADLAGRSDGR